MEKYEEVLHNLEFARELHKTLDGLTQTVRVTGDWIVLVSVYWQKSDYFCCNDRSTV